MTKKTTTKQTKTNSLLKTNQAYYNKKKAEAKKK